MSKSYKLEEVESTVEDAVSIALGEIETLGSELRNWHDNLPDSLQTSERAETLNEAAIMLESCDTIDVPPFLTGSEHKVTYSISVKPGKARGKESRAVRRDNTVAALAAVMEYCDQWLDENEAPDAENESDDAKLLREQRDDVETFRDEIENIKDDIEVIEFPGAFS